MTHNMRLWSLILETADTKTLIKISERFAHSITLDGTPYINLYEFKDEPLKEKLFSYSNYIKQQAVSCSEFENYSFVPTKLNLCMNFEMKTRLNSILVPVGNGSHLVIGKINPYYMVT